MIPILIIGLVLLYMVYAAILYISQHALMFPGKRTLAGVDPPDLPEGAEPFWVTVQGKPVEVWFLPPTDPMTERVPLVIFAHGNAELIDFFKDRFQVFRENGLAVALVSYPGFGRSKGSPSEESVNETFLKAYDALAERDDVDEENIILMGRSMGGGAASLLAKQKPSIALVLISTYQSMRAMTRRYGVPASFVRSPFDNISSVSAYTKPVLILHGPNDKVIPYRQGVALSEAATDGTLWTYEGVAHVDCPPNWDDFCVRTLAFFKERGILTHV